MILQAPDDGDLEDLLSAVTTAHRDVRDAHGDSFSINELLEHDAIRSLAETGFRFHSARLPGGGGGVVNDVEQSPQNR